MARLVDSLFAGSVPAPDAHATWADPARLESPPAWDGGLLLRTDDYRAPFDRTASFTVGIEEELMLIDPETRGLAPEIEHALAVVCGDRRFTRELRQAQLEIVTPDGNGFPVVLVAAAAGAGVAVAVVLVVALMRKKAKAPPEAKAVAEKKKEAL